MYIVCVRNNTINSLNRHKRSELLVFPYFIIYIASVAHRMAIVRTKKTRTLYPVVCYTYDPPPTRPIIDSRPAHLH